MTDMAQLMEIAKEKDAEIERLQDINHALRDDLVDANKEIERLQKDNGQLANVANNWMLMAGRYHKALEFYEDESNYYQPKPFATPFVEVDKGEKARQALKGESK